MGRSRVKATHRRSAFGKRALFGQQLFQRGHQRAIVGLDLGLESFDAVAVAIDQVLVEIPLACRSAAG